MVEQKIVQIKPNQLEYYIGVIDSTDLAEVSKALVNVCNKYSHKFREGEIVGTSPNNKINKEIRNVKTWLLGEDYEDVCDIHWSHYLTNMLKNCFKVYATKLKEPLDLTVKEVNILKYNVGGHYKVHTDHHYTMPRTLSFIVFINEDYEGGNLEFLLPDENNIFTVEKKKGRVVVFPSNFLYRHRVVPITKGERISVVGWMC